MDAATGRYNVCERLSVFQSNLATLRIANDEFYVQTAGGAGIQLHQFAMQAFPARASNPAWNLRIRGQLADSKGQGSVRRRLTAAHCDNAEWSARRFGKA